MKCQRQSHSRKKKGINVFWRDLQYVVAKKLKELLDQKMPIYVLVTFCLMVIQSNCKNEKYAELFWSDMKPGFRVCLQF